MELHVYTYLSSCSMDCCNSAYVTEKSRFRLQVLPSDDETLILFFDGWTLWGLESEGLL